MKAVRRWALKTLAGLLVLAVLLLAGVVYRLVSTLPTTEGEIAFPGLLAPVEVTRDGWGIVRIRAGSLPDAWRALGFVHAQDRMAQMELNRRIGRGRLAEVLGEGGLWVDRYMRTLGIARVAEANVEAISPEGLETLEAYAEGVNAAIESGEASSPLTDLVPSASGALLGDILPAALEPWTPADSVIWGRLMAMQLSGNFPAEIVRAKLEERGLTREEIEFMWPSYPADAPVTVAGAPSPTSRGDRGALAQIPWALRPKSASNAWALAPARTATGGALLANDPHLGLRIPGEWHLARVETPELTLAGAFAPGVPLLIMGHNEKLAWGFVTTHSDTQDLFRERIDPNDPSRYRTPDGLETFAFRDETIRVRFADPVTLQVRESRHGPIVSDVLDSAAEIADEDEAIALAWPGLDSDDRSVDALLRLNRASSVAEGIEALKALDSPQQNITLADAAGSIGFVAPGKVPVRLGADGRYPQNGWERKGEWSGYVPFEALPRTVDPPEGLIVTANNKVSALDVPLLAADWIYPFRAERIVGHLDKADGVTLEDTARFQLDVKSEGAARLVPLLLAATPEAFGQEWAHEMLGAWDFRMDPAQAAPLLFTAWTDELGRLVFADELGESFDDFRGNMTLLLIRVLRDSPVWCDDRRTGERVEGCGALAAEALARADELLARTHGADHRAWRWGDAHLTDLRHPLFSRLPLLGQRFRFDLPAPGGQDTVNRGGFRYDRATEGRYTDVHGPTLRGAYDLAAPERSRFMIVPGQSDHPLSAHMTDLIEPWLEGRTLTLGPEAETPVEVLTLVPAEP